MNLLLYWRVKIIRTDYRFWQTLKHRQRQTSVMDLQLLPAGLLHSDLEKIIATAKYLKEQMPECMAVKGF